MHCRYINAAILSQYGGGVLPATACSSSNINHAVMAVGYNLAEGWIRLQNSWCAHSLEGRKILAGFTCKQKPHNSL